jgi:hypothetical protein
MTQQHPSALQRAVRWFREGPWHVPAIISVMLIVLMPLLPQALKWPVGIVAIAAMLLGMIMLIMRPPSRPGEL